VGYWKNNGMSIPTFLLEVLFYSKIAGTLFVINRIGVTGRYPQNIKKGS